MSLNPPLERDLKRLMERTSRTSYSWKEWQEAILQGIAEDFSGLTYRLKQGVVSLALHYEPSWPDDIHWIENGECKRCRGFAILGDDDVSEEDQAEGLEPGSPCPECNLAGHVPGREMAHAWDHAYFPAPKWIMRPEEFSPPEPLKSLLDEEFDFS